MVIQDFWRDHFPAACTRLGLEPLRFPREGLNLPIEPDGIDVHAGRFEFAERRPQFVGLLPPTFQKKRTRKTRLLGRLLRIALEAGRQLVQPVGIVSGGAVERVAFHHDHLGAGALQSRGEGNVFL